MVINVYIQCILYICTLYIYSCTKSFPGGRRKDHWGTLWAHGGGGGCLPKSFNFFPRYARNAGEEGARSFSEKG